MKRKIGVVWLRVSTLSGEARRTSQDTAKTRTVSLPSFFFIMGTPFRGHVMEILTRNNARRYAWSWGSSKFLATFLAQSKLPLPLESSSIKSFSLPRTIDCQQMSKRQNRNRNNYNYEVERFSSFNRLHNLPCFPPPTAEFLLCEGQMHYRVISVHSHVR